MDNSKIVISLHVDNVSVRRDVDETPVVLVQDPSKCSRLGYLCHDRHSCSRLRYFCDYCIRIACLLVFRGGKSKILLREGSVYFHGQFLDIYIIVGYSTSEHKKLGSPCPKSHGILPFFAFFRIFEKRGVLLTSRIPCDFTFFHPRAGPLGSQLTEFAPLHFFDRTPPRYIFRSRIHRRKKESLTSPPKIVWHWRQICRSFCS